MAERALTDRLDEIIDITAQTIKAVA